MKKLLLSLCFGVALLAPSAANAYTVDDLVGKNCAVFATGTQISHPGLGQRSWNATIKKGSGANELILENFMGSFDLPVTLSNDRLIINSSGKTYQGKGALAGLRFELGRRVYDVTYKQYIYNGKYRRADLYDHYTGTFTSSTLGLSNQLGILNGVQAISCSFSNGADGFYIQDLSNTGSAEAYGSFNLFIYDTNAKATEVKANGEVVNYNMLVEKDPVNQTYTIRNFFDYGLAYINELGADGYGGSDAVDVVVSYDNDGVLTLRAQQIQGQMFDHPIFWNIIRVTSGWYVTDYIGYWEVEGDLFHSRYYLCSDSDSRAVYGLYGELESNEAAHNTTNYWEKNCGGDLITSTSETLKFGDIKVYSTYHANYLGNPYARESKSLTIKIDEQDLTHSVQQAINDLDVSPVSGQTIVKTTIHSPKNNNYVESYDLYIVPGEYRTVQDESFDFHNVKGHSLGVCLKEDIPATGAQQTIELDDFYPELIGMGLGKSDKYTLYLKANYLQSSGLEPTFHALATQMVTTGLENIEAEEAEGEATFFNTNGVQVNNENMAPGVYIKKQGNKTSKVIVR